MECKHCGCDGEAIEELFDQYHAEILRLKALCDANNIDTNAPDADG